ncbi:MAG: glycosyltransferase family 4 protein [Alphaproteobacteria bacterium]
MKILFVAPRFHTNQFYLVKALKKEGHDVSFFAITKGNSENYNVLEPKIIKPSILFNLLKNIFKFNYSRTIRSFFPNIISYALELKKAQPNLIIARDPNTIFLSFLTIILAKIFGIKAILYCQNPLETMPKTKRCVLLSKLLGFKWITPVKNIQDNIFQLNQFYFYVPFAIEVTSKKIVPCDKIKIISVGKFVERKNLHLLIKAVCDLKAKYDLSLTIIGENSTPEHLQYFAKITDLIKQNNADDYITIKNNLPHNDILAEYQKHNLFVLPSSKEPASFSQLEAMSCALPVICSNDNGTSCYIKQNANGYLFEKDNENDLKNKIERVISSKDNILNFSNESIKLTINNHNPENIIKRIFSLYD